VTVLAVTGTGTGVGKTVTTAAVAALAAEAGRRVCVVKLAQTGVGPGDESDVDVVVRLSGVTDVHELARYPEPLAPATAARRAGMRPLDVPAMVDRVSAFLDRDLVLVEGAGGLLVRLDAEDRTLADAAAALGAHVLVVAAAGLGELSATALTCEALRARDIPCAGIVVGSWPLQPDLACRTNLDDLPAYAGARLVGCLPADAGRLDRSAFVRVAGDSLAAALGGGWSGRPPESSAG
jgi:dethiobiotin synthetase